MILLLVLWVQTPIYIYIDKHSPSVHRLEGPTSQPASTISEGKWLSLSNISPCWCLFLPLGTPVKIRNEGVRMGEVSKFQGSTMCFVFFFGGGNMFFFVEVELRFLFFQSGIRIRDEWNKTFWRTGCTEAYNMKPKKEGSLGRCRSFPNRWLADSMLVFQDVRVRM